MQVKVDEDLPRSVAQRLSAAGFDTRTILEQGMGGFKDEQLWPIVQEEQRFLVTADKGFADIRRHPPGRHAGVLLLRPDRDGVQPVVELLEQVLSSVDFADLSGTVAVATPRGLRVRR